MWKLLDTLTGIGDVFQGPERLGSMSYTLEIHQDEVRQRIQGKAKALDGVDVQSLARDGAPLTAYLADGRCLDFFFEADGSIKARQKGLYHPTR